MAVVANQLPTDSAAALMGPATTSRTSPTRVDSVTGPSTRAATSPSASMTSVLGIAFGGSVPRKPEQRAAALVADARVGDARRGGERARGGHVVADVDAQERHTVAAQAAGRCRELRRLGSARRAPGAPDVEHDDAARKVAEGKSLAVQARACHDRCGPAVRGGEDAHGARCRTRSPACRSWTRRRRSRRGAASVPAQATPIRRRPGGDRACQAPAENVAVRSWTGSRSAAGSE
jgi:hypothetical protein